MVETKNNFKHNNDTAQHNKQVNYKGLYAKKFIGFLGSMRTGIVLLIVLAAIASLGSLIPQQQPAQHYYEQYNQSMAEAVLFLGLDNLYEVWWFVALIVLLCANLFFCSFTRLPGIWKRTFNPHKKLEENRLHAFQSAQEITLELKNRKAVQKIEACLKQHRYKTERLAHEQGQKYEGSQGKTYLFAEKARFGYFGSFLTHISIVVLVVGFAYGNMVGFEDYIHGIPGDILEIEQADFQVQVDNFEIDYREDYSVKQYYSNLTVIEDKKTIKQEEIFVNRPLRYEGVNIYQSNHGWVGKMEVTNLRTGFEDRTRMYEDTEYRPMGLAKSVFFHSFFPDYDMSEDGPVNRSPFPNNPRFVWILYEGPEIVDMFVTEPGETVEHGDIEVTFTGYDQYTGLRVVHDPGIPVFFFGSGLMVLGLILSFFLYPRRIWTVVVPDEGSGGTKVIVAGKGLKDHKNFQKELENLRNKIEGDHHADKKMIKQQNKGKE